MPTSMLAAQHSIERVIQNTERDLYVKQLMKHIPKYNLSKAMMLSSNLTKISNASPDLRKDDGLI